MKKNNTRNKKIISSVIIWILYIVWLLKISSLTVSITNFIVHLLFLGIIVFIFKDELLENLKEFKTNTGTKITKILLYFLVFIGIMLISNVILSLVGVDTSQTSSSKMISNVFNNVPFGTLFACFLTIIFYPVVEELMFRKSLRPAIENGVLFVIITSLLSWYFQVTLLNPSINEFILAIQTLLNSIFAGIVYVKTNNIIYTISSRMLFNILICVIQLGFLITT
mgnify:FL=1